MTQFGISLREAETYRRILQIKMLPCDSNCEYRSLNRGHLQLRRTLHFYTERMKVSLVNVLKGVHTFWSKMQYASFCLRFDFKKVFISFGREITQSRSAKYDKNAWPLVRVKWLSGSRWHNYFEDPNFLVLQQNVMKLWRSYNCIKRGIPVVRGQHDGSLAGFFRRNGSGRAGFASLTQLDQSLRGTFS
jgi:hypothetical protein